jgi:energy-coupling factor transport system ATP-binding protein
MTPFIQTLGLEHAYSLEGGVRVEALRGVDLTIEPGDFVALIGPNGSGKSTLARHFNALLLPTAGQVRVDGMLTSDPRHVWAIRRSVGMVFQNPDNQFVASTVEEDVAFGPENMALPQDEIRARVDEALALVGMADYRTHPPQRLSGGQKQRVAIAGALATRPSCLVFDEPTSMLDPPSRREVLDIMRQLNAEEGITLVLITQSMDEAAAARRVVAMHQGCIALDGPPQVVFDQREQLEALGLDLPFPIELSHRLRERGIALPPGLLTVQDLAGALC